MERGEGREKEKERDTDVQEKHQLVASHMPPTRDLNCKPGECSDQESNWRPLVCGTMPNTLSHTRQGGSFTKEIFLGNFELFNSFTAIF